MPFYPADHLYSKYCIGRKFSHLIYSLMASGLFKNALEIGCLQGYSTWAFLSALRDGPGFSFTACDLFFQQSVLDMVKPFPVMLANKMSVEVISPEFDFVFVDGNHDLQTVGEEIGAILDAGTDTILAHDTFLESGGWADGCDLWDFKGAVLLRKVFSAHRDYLSLHFHETIPDDQTHYGISLFTKRKIVHDMAFQLLKDH